MANIKWTRLSLLVMIAVGLVIGFILPACQVAERNQLSALTLTPTTTPEVKGISSKSGESISVEQMAYEWLAGIPCSPPCWEGITPGQTTFSETLMILEQLPLVTNVKTLEGGASYSADKGEIYWDWQGTTRGGGKASYYIGSTIYEISVGYPHRLFTLQDVIDVYGEPSHVYAWAIPSSDGTYTVYGLDVVYIPRGFALEMNSANNLKPHLGSDWSDFHLLFFQPTVEGFGLAYGNPNVSLVPWQGMLSFDDYCIGPDCN